MSINIDLKDRKGNVTFIALISPEDKDNVTKYKWHHKDKHYAIGWIDGKKMFMHHLIIGKPPDNMVVDHINGNGFDNTRENLRFATRSQNSQNADKRKSKDDYIGVSIYKKVKKWRVQCQGKTLGYYENAIDGALIYDKYTYLLFGEHAKNNKLITYNECKDLDISQFSKSIIRELPKNIYIKGTNFFVRICKIQSENFKTLDEAQNFLNNYLKKKQEKKEEEHNNKPITRNEEGQVIIECIKGNVLVDDKLWHSLTKYSWSIDNSGYASGNVNNKVVRMHRYIMELNGHNLEEITKSKNVIDHINNNKIDNRYENLRVNTLTGNGHNKTKKENASSKYKGVTYFKRDKNWLVQITKDNTYYYGGYYKTEEEAAIAYNIKAIEIYGKEYANLNII
jgi:hypothetical protein